MTTKFLNILFVGIIAVCCSSCGEYEALDIDKKAKRSADSLYRTKLDSLRTLTDSLCNVNHEKYYKRALDSLKKEQLLKAERLIER